MGGIVPPAFRDSFANGSFNRTIPPFVASSFYFPTSRISGQGARTTRTKSGSPLPSSSPGGGWRVTLTPTEDQEETLKYLKVNSGYGITNVGCLEKEGGLTFTAEEAFEVLKAFASYASFAVGRWVGPCLPTGFDGDGNKVWLGWDYFRTVPDRHRNTWLDYHHGEQFEITFAGFLKRWLDEDWEEDHPRRDPLARRSQRPSGVDRRVDHPHPSRLSSCWHQRFSSRTIR